MNNASDADACIAVSFKEFDTAILKCVNIFDPIMETCALPSKTSNDAGCTESRAVLAICRYKAPSSAILFKVHDLVESILAEWSKPVNTDN